MGKISEEKLERRVEGTPMNRGVCLPRSEPMAWLGNLGLLVRMVGGSYRSLNCQPAEEPCYPGTVRRQERSLPSRPALVCVIRRRVEVWQYQGRGVGM